jgi:5-methylcytosine-specific restriction endonuclease McrBC regulatory subunit McrC
VDAKYKIYDDREVDPEDIAQIFLYAYAYDQSAQPSAVLIYPTEEKSDKRTSMMIRQNNQPTGARIHVLGLNIPEALADVRGKKCGQNLTALITNTCSQAFL